eukprot:TRINITY_DN1025_c0_g1_i2.p1 TRINITY_DN1025_c0_g1~~TRINITY_DN1025_c0_g1_i2.p1  ORF type:complete len:186 (+),score=31.04 TRINITY_DN1025_c0_g1_i2:48-560(+)
MPGNQIDVKDRNSSFSRKQEDNVLKKSKFVWKDRKEFAWNKGIYHLLASPISDLDGSFVSETVLTPKLLSVYTDHRVMGSIVLPGASHVGYMAATAAMSYGAGKGDNWHVKITDVLFERPFFVGASPSVDNGGADQSKRKKKKNEPDLIGYVACQAGSSGRHNGMIPIGN